MATKTSGQKTSRTNVKKLKGNPKELTATEQKKVRGGKFAASDVIQRNAPGNQHNETLVRDSTS